MSGDPEQICSDGISEDIITDLSKVSELNVIARNSSFTYKGKPVDVKRVGRELGVRYVLEGSGARLATGSKARASSSTLRAARISGPTASTATSPTSSRCRTN